MDFHQVNTIQKKINSCSNEYKKLFGDTFSNFFTPPSVDQKLKKLNLKILLMGITFPPFEEWIPQEKKMLGF